MAKRLLLIAPVFFGYYKDIMEEARSLGFEVDYLCDAPSDSNVSKAFGRINKKFIQLSTNRYFSNEIKPLIGKNQYDYVLLIGGMTFALTEKMMEEIRKSQSKAKFMMYQWDSEKNLPYSTKIHKYFDELYTFDRIDSISMDKYKFLPLFYNHIYETIGKMKKSAYKYDCMYVGTAHPQKYYDINRMARGLKSVMPNQFIYHYMPSALKYVYQKVKSPLFRKAKWSEFKHEKVASKELMEIFSDSKCILDAPQAGQVGLTIRTIECLGAKRKLVTTNSDIKNYDFYNENNILIYSEPIDLDSPFFKNEYEELPDEMYEKYSLKNWLITMIGKET